MARPRARRGLKWRATFTGRALLAVGVPVQLWLVWLNWPSWWVLPNLLMAVVLVLLGIGSERRAREQERSMWTRAEQSGDPLAYLAGASYLDKLTMPELLEFLEWMSTSTRQTPSTQRCRPSWPATSRCSQAHRGSER